MRLRSYDACVAAGRGWLLVVAGCVGGRAAGDPDASSPDAAPAPPLEVGGYRLELTNSFFWSPGPRLSLGREGGRAGTPG